MQAARQHVAAPYSRTVGIELVRADAERARLRLGYREQNANRNGTLHGGVLASLVDVAAAVAAVADGSTRGRRSHTADLALQFVAPARREAVTADARIVRRGRVITFVTVDVTTESGQPVAHGIVARGVHTGAGTPVTTMLPPLPDSARGSGSPFGRLLGVRRAQTATGEALAVLPVHPALTDRHGHLHEGALAALADGVGGAAAWSVAGRAAGRRASTIALQLAVTAVPRDEHVAALARTAWQDGVLFVSTVVLAGHASGRVFASGSVTYRIAPARA